MTTTQPEITQADREAAARYERLTCSPVAEVIVNGEADAMQLVQAFAHHRITSAAPLVEAGNEIIRIASLPYEGKPTIGLDAAIQKWLTAIAQYRGEVK